MNKQYLKIVCVVFCLIWCSLPVVAAEWEVEPRISVQETYTDNVNLAPFNEEWDLVTTLSSGVSLDATGSRLELSLDYTINYLAFAQDEDRNDFRHNLLAAGTAELARELFFVDVRASVSQQFLDRTQAVSFSQQNDTENRQTTQTYIVSPYFRRSLGPWADAELRYQAAFFRTQDDDIETTNQQISSSTTQTVSFILDSNDRRFNRVRWNIFLEARRRENRGSDNDRQLARFDTQLIFDRRFSVVGSVGIENIEEQSVTQDIDGLLWDVGVRLNPGPRTSIEWRYGQRFNDDTWSLSASYLLGDHTTVQVRYDERIETTQTSIANRLTFAIIDTSTLEIIDPFTGQRFDQSELFTLRDFATKNERLAASVFYRRGRTSFNARFTYEKEDLLVSGDDEDIKSVSAGISRQISPMTSASASFFYRESIFGFPSFQEEEFYAGTAQITHQLGENVSVSVSYVISYRDSNIDITDLKENAVSLIVLATF